MRLHVTIAVHLNMIREKVVGLLVRYQKLLYYLVHSLLYTVEAMAAANYTSRRTQMQCPLW